MAKSDVTQEQARALVDRVAQELGLLVSDASFGPKIQGPTNKHRIHIQKTQMLGRIDTTLPVKGEEGTLPLSNPNGSITCHIVPTLENLEKFLRMLGDGAMAVQVPNKPRPFAATKGPGPGAAGRRVPRATAPALPGEDLAAPEVRKVDGETLEQRLDRIKSRARLARVRRVMEERNVTAEEAEAILDARVPDGDAVVEALSQARDQQELNNVLADSGIEVEQ